MRLSIMIEPQFGASYADQARLATHAEDQGFEAFFRSDHLLTMSAGTGLPGPTDTWAVLAGLARDTSRIRLGAMVTSATFRLPGPLAVTVATVDQMSSGRVEFGLGAGWFEAEHAAYGIPFPPVAERFDRLEEQLAIATGLWRTPVGERFDFDGKYYQLTDSPALPKPAQTPCPPIIVGGHGKTRTPHLAVRYADEFNAPFADVATTAALFRRVEAVSQELNRTTQGRAPLVLSVAQTIACGRTDAQARNRADSIGRTPPLYGTVNQIVDQIGTFAAVGATRVHLQILDIADLDHLDVIASDVAPQLR